MAPMFIANPLRKKVSLFDSLSNLSSTHPPIQKRIEALQNKNVDADMLDEVVREQFGVSLPEEYVIYD